MLQPDSYYTCFVFIRAHTSSSLIYISFIRARIAHNFFSLGCFWVIVTCMLYVTLVQYIFPLDSHFLTRIEEEEEEICLFNIVCSYTYSAM